jgi:ABC-type Mn2+/Zn2+ transport system permease subunit
MPSLDVAFNRALIEAVLVGAAAGMLGVQVVLRAHGVDIGGHHLRHLSVYR